MCKLRDLLSPALRARLDEQLAILVRCLGLGLPLPLSLTQATSNLSPSPSPSLRHTPAPYPYPYPTPTPNLGEAALGRLELRRRGRRCLEHGDHLLVGLALRLLLLDRQHLLRARRRVGGTVRVSVTLRVSPAPCLGSGLGFSQRPA